MKVFIDTNVLLDYVCSRTGYLESAKTIFLLGFEQEIELCISSLSFINCYYIGKKYGFDKLQLRTSLSGIETFVTVTPTGQDVIRQAFNSTFKDVEDGTQYYSALLFQADIIVTRNVKDFKESAIPVMTPDEFLSRIK